MSPTGRSSLAIAVDDALGVDDALAVNGAALIAIGLLATLTVPRLRKL